MADDDDKLLQNARKSKLDDVLVGEDSLSLRQYTKLPGKWDTAKKEYKAGDTSKEKVEALKSVGITVLDANYLIEKGYKNIKADQGLMVDVAKEKYVPLSSVVINHETGKLPKTNNQPQVLTSFVEIKIDDKVARTSRSTNIGDVTKGDTRIKKYGSVGWISEDTYGDDRKETFYLKYDGKEDDGIHDKKLMMWRTATITKTGMLIQRTEFVVDGADEKTSETLTNDQLLKEYKEKLKFLNERGPEPKKNAPKPDQEDSVSPTAMSVLKPVTRTL